MRGADRARAAAVLTLDECVAIAPEAQPQIAATLQDYAAARYRVNEALAPLLPQLTGAVSAARLHTITLSTLPPTGPTFQGPDQPAA